MSTPVQQALRVYDFAPQRDEISGEVLAGLRLPQKELPCKLFYDAPGSQLFEQICNLPEYYPTRTELAIMRTYGDEMAELFGPGCQLIEYGSGSSTKTRVLLDALERPAAYVPIDISKTQLAISADALARAYPTLEVLPVCADYSETIDLPAPSQAVLRRVVYFPGSTIGNFHPHEALRFLRRIADICGPSGALLIGVDLKKDPTILHAAYNDSAGVTAAFNLNILARLNRELGADFQLDQYRHYACYNPQGGRIEMHLASLTKQRVQLAGTTIRMQNGETIWTESSYKYRLDEFEDLANAAGFAVLQYWTDPDSLFSVQYLAVR